MKGILKFHVLLAFVYIQMLYSEEYKPKIYDCFLFYDELEILNIRFHEMDSQVDQFVLVESVETFRGNPKPLVFEKNTHLFENYADKIIHVVVEAYPTNNPWDREAFQRGAIIRGLAGCRGEDIILVSDVDEIVRNQDIPSIREALLSHQYEEVGVVQRYHSNYLNSVPGGPWRGTVATTFLRLQTYFRSTQGMRGMKDQVPAVASGWHFTWQGGIDQILKKIASFSHYEMDTPEIREEKRKGFEQRLYCPVIEVDESFPAFVRENIDYYESIGYVLTPQKQQEEIQKRNLEKVKERKGHGRK